MQKSRILEILCAAFVLLVLVSLYAPAFVTPFQPVAVAYIENAKLVEPEVLVIARKLTAKYKMKFFVEHLVSSADRANPQPNVMRLFDATKNGWLYRLGFVAGSEPEFGLEVSEGKICLIIVGAHDHPEVQQLVNDWVSELDAAKLKYALERRAPRKR